MKCRSICHGLTKDFKNYCIKGKKVKLQWLQNTSEVNGDNLNNVRSETSRHFRNKKRKYVKDKINELATNSKNKNIRNLYRGIN
jgi:hypothetical protein